MKSTKRNYELGPKLMVMACIFFMSLCLQSCAHSDHTTLPIQQKQKDDNSPIYIEQHFAETDESTLKVLPTEITAMILHRAAIDECLNNRNPINIQLVCKEWQQLIEEGTIGGKTIKQLCQEAWYGVPGHEEIYESFLKGVLIYRPQKGSDVGRIDLPIAELGNPLEGTFDLSRCGGVDYYLSISTGYRKRKKVGNGNKLEVWFAPRFLIEKKLSTTARHFQEIYGEWSDKAPVGIFWTWGGHEDGGLYDYLATKTYDELSTQDLNHLHNNAPKRLLRHLPRWNAYGHELLPSLFHIHFVN